MKLLLEKELKLTASPLSYFFIAFALMTIIPGYPILVGAFFVCMGIFQTFLSAREANDTMFTALLPVKKSDVVKARFTFVTFIQGVYVLICILLTVLRMSFLSEAQCYLENAMMNANFYYIGYIFVILGLFNIIFVAWHYKTAYKVGIPFVIFSVAAFLSIAVFESLHFFPGLAFLNTTNYSRVVLQVCVMLAGAILYLLLTFISLKKSIRSFQKIDL